MRPRASTHPSLKGAEISPAVSLAGRPRGACPRTPRRAAVVARNARRAGRYPHDIRQRHRTRTAQCQHRHIAPARRCVRPGHSGLVLRHRPRSAIPRRFPARRTRGGASSTHATDGDGSRDGGLLPGAGGATRQATRAHSRQRGPTLGGGVRGFARGQLLKSQAGRLLPTRATVDA